MSWERQTDGGIDLWHLYFDLWVSHSRSRWFQVFRSSDRFTRRGSLSLFLAGRPVFVPILPFPLSSVLILFGFLTINHPQSSFEGRESDGGVTIRRCNTTRERRRSGGGGDNNDKERRRRRHRFLNGKFFRPPRHTVAPFFQIVCGGLASSLDNESG